MLAEDTRLGGQRPRTLLLTAQEKTSALCISSLCPHVALRSCDGPRWHQHVQERDQGQVPSTWSGSKQALTYLNVRGKVSLTIRRPRHKLARMFRAHGGLPLPAGPTYSWSFQLPFRVTLVQKPTAPSADSPGLAAEDPPNVDLLLEENGVVGCPCVSLCLNKNTPHTAPPTLSWFQFLLDCYIHSQFLFDGSTEKETAPTLQLG